MWTHFPKPPDALKWDVNHELWLRMQMSALSSFIDLRVVSLGIALSWMISNLDPVLRYPTESILGLCYFCSQSYTAVCSLKKVCADSSSKTHFTISKETNSVPKQPSIYLHHKHKQARGWIHVSFFDLFWHRREAHWSCSRQSSSTTWMEGGQRNRF